MNRHFTPAVAAALACALLAPTCARGDLIYAINPFFSNVALYSIDPANGHSHKIGDTGADELIGIALDKDDRLLSIDAGGNFLYELNKSTGAAHQLFNLNFADLFYEGDLAINRLSNKAFAIEENTIYSLNVSNGQLNALGNLKFMGSEISSDNNIDGLAFRGEDLFGLLTIQSDVGLDNHLIQIDPVTLEIKSIGDLGIEFSAESDAGVAGMTYDPKLDRFYVAGGGPKGIFSVNPLNGHATLIGDPGLNEIAGLALDASSNAIPLPPAYLSGASVMIAAFLLGWYKIPRKA